MLMSNVRAEQLMRDIGQDVVDSLTSEQEAAIRAAANRNPWRRHPFDLRFSLPLPIGHWYFVIIAGPERRSAARLQQERLKHPLATRNNLAILAVALGIVGLGVYLGLTLSGIL